MVEMPEDVKIFIKELKKRGKGVKIVAIEKSSSPDEIYDVYIEGKYVGVKSADEVFKEKRIVVCRKSICTAFIDNVMEYVFDRIKKTIIECVYKWEEFIKDYPRFKNLEHTICAGCGRTFKEIVESGETEAVLNSVFISADGRYEYPYGLNDITLCYYCYENETNYSVGEADIFVPVRNAIIKVTVSLFNNFYFVSEDDIPDDVYQEAMVIVHEFANEVGTSIRFVQTDQRRDYEVDREKLKNWKILHDMIVYGSEREKKLKKFDEKIRKTLEEKNIPYARLFLNTSNLFSSVYMLLIRTKDVDEADIAYLHTLASMYGSKHRDKRGR
ncbi:MAG: hypothetical protein J7L47_03030 [Candidatus Odinarchaeota archaeon]|nr:hypothetical protein [Candidatus Odinarchaeota archaeon]